MKTVAPIMIALALVITIGCEVPELEKPDAAAAPKPKVEEIAKEDNRLDMSEVPGEPPPTTEKPREFTAKDSKQGKLSRQAGGYLGAVASARFTAVNKMTINQIKHNLEIYNADKGHYPKTHEEFMENFLPYSGVTLPALEEGDEYLYDPEDHTLKIYRPEE